MVGASLLPVVLILVSAILHVTWNLMVKRGGDTLVALWALDLAPPLLLWPLLFVLGPPDARGVALAVASGFVHAVASVMLAEAYSRGDLSVVYPVARGLAPVLVVAGAHVTLGERLSAPGLVAVLLVATGVTWLGLSARNAARGAAGLGWAVAMAVCIATYSIVDKAGVTGTQPVAFAVVFMVFESMFLTPYVLLRRGAGGIVVSLRGQAALVVGSALISLVGYVLVLIAMRLTQVGYVAALREVSVVLAAVVGWVVLREPLGLQRVLAAALAAAGLILLSVTVAR